MCVKKVNGIFRKAIHIIIAVKKEHNSLESLNSGFHHDNNHVLSVNNPL